MEANNLMTVYHGCSTASIGPIKAGILDVDSGKASDFTSFAEGRGFYTTTDRDFARDWAIKQHGEASAAVMRFQFNPAGLTVRDFGHEKSKDYAKWQKCIFDNYNDKERAKKDKLTEWHTIDVIIGMISDADDESNPWSNARDVKPIQAPGPITQVFARSNKAMEDDRWVHKGTEVMEDGEWKSVPVNKTF